MLFLQTMILLRTYDTTYRVTIPVPLGSKLIGTDERVGKGDIGRASQMLQKNRVKLLIQIKEDSSTRLRD